MKIRKAEEKDIPRIMELLGQVLQSHAEIRPDVFIPGTTKYTASELKELLEMCIRDRNCSYNLGMRHLKGYIPEYPVGMAEDIADKIAEFVPIARTILGVRDLKIITL